MAANRSVSITELRRNCSALLTEIEIKRVSLTITRFGKPVAVLAPGPSKPLKSPRNSWAGKIREAGDIIDPDF